MPPLKDNQDPASGIRPKVASFSRRNALYCALLTGLCIVAIYPVANVPLGDDFSYTKTALDFARTGHFVYNGWATASLGWQVLWGALFIKLFGFSFTIVRLSTIPVACATVYLFHQVLVRFGIDAQNAVLGALALGISPLFLLLASSYLTDIPGVFVLVLCMYMCQRAIIAGDRRAAFLWLIAAAILNLIGGTVRQTSWFGGLFMIPSTAWLLRRQRGMLPLAALLFTSIIVGILGCLRWVNHQLFFVPESFHVSSLLHDQSHMLGQMTRLLLCLVFLLLPLVAGWLVTPHSLSRAAVIRIALITGFFAAALLVRANRAPLDDWIVPWLPPVLQAIGMASPDKIFGGVGLLPINTRIILSLLTVIAGSVMVEKIVQILRNSPLVPLSESDALRSALWLVGPFICLYLSVLLPRAASGVLQDRYLLGVIPPLIVLLLLVHQRWIATALPRLSVAVLILFAVYGITGSRNIYSFLRAGQKAVEEMLSAGVPQTSIAEGFGPDGWLQVERMGFINSSNMVGADEYYNPHVPAWDLPQGCSTYSLQTYASVIHPEYFVTLSPTSCLTPSRFPPVDYIAWSLPFHRRAYVEQIQKNH